jgi:hypothetical protein
VDYALLDGSGGCNCVDNWSGPGCALYAGQCAPICDGCVGPEITDCSLCADNAYWNEQFICQCKAGYKGDSCQEWHGACTGYCKTCNGPEQEDCLQCIDNARWELDGDLGSVTECTCLPYWTGLECQVYTGDCDPKCDYEYKCTGPRPCDCGECNENAFWKVSDSVTGDLECACKPDYDGLYCKIYVGHCDPKCETSVAPADTTIFGGAFCVGPSASECIRCVENAGKNDVGECVCGEDFTGSSC